MTAMEQVVAFVVTVGGIGILTHFIGEALPRSWFCPDRFPYRTYQWEQGGAFYQRLHIQAWKTKLPDKNSHVKGCVKKRMAGDSSAAHAELLIRETCVAECIHWVLLLISPVLLWTMEGPAAVVMTVLYGLSNLPFIMIQRYNRPRLAKLAAMARARDAAKMQKGLGAEAAEEAAPAVPLSMPRQTETDNDMHKEVHAA